MIRAEVRRIHAHFVLVRGPRRAPAAMMTRVLQASVRPGGFIMRRLTRALAAVLAATPLLLVGAVAGSPAARAATAYPPGGPDRTPVMGWSGWSFLRLGATEAQVEGEAKALVSSGLAKAGYDYVNIDDGWYQCPGSQGPNVDANGRWVVNTATYPSVGSENGIQALAAYAHSPGLKFGIYETAGISSRAVARNTPILGTDDTADGIATTTSQNNYNCGGMDAIDYSAPGAQAYVDSTVDELASWGVDYIKLDGITDQNGPDEGSADACNTAPYTGCTSVFPLTDYAAWDDRFDSVAQWQPYGGPGGFNDYDSIEVGDGSADSGLSLAASETQLSLWSLGSAPLVLGGDLTGAVTNAYGSSASLTPTDLSLLTNAQVIKDVWVTEYVLTYDGKPAYTVSIMRFEAGKVVHETQYFADPFEAPAWRASLVEIEHR
jgi:alpha-galactosidase